MKKALTLATILMVGSLAFVSVASAASAVLSTSLGAVQQPDLEARLQGVEQRIMALKQKVMSNKLNRSYQGSVASLENKKNELKAKLKIKNAAANPQLEQALKELEEKTTQLEGSVK